MSAPTKNTVKTDDVRKAVNTAIEQVRTPLLAALGAGNLAGQALSDAMNKAKERGEVARKNIEELPTEVENLRGKLDPAELRKVIDEYTDAALKLYHKLAESGEQAWDKFSTQPQVKKAIDQFEEVATETRDRVEDVLGKVTKKTRSVGEKTANTVERVADDAAEAIEELGDDVAHEVRSGSRKAANKTAPRPTAARRTTPAATTNAATTNAAAAKKPANGTPKTEK